MPANPSETKVFKQDRAQFTYKWKASVSRGFTEFRLFCHDKPRNFANWPAEFGKIVHEKLVRFKPANAWFH